MHDEHENHKKQTEKVFITNAIKCVVTDGFWFLFFFSVKNRVAKFQIKSDKKILVDEILFTVLIVFIAHV